MITSQVAWQISARIAEKDKLVAALRIAVAEVLSWSVALYALADDLGLI